MRLIDHIISSTPISQLTSSFPELHMQTYHNPVQLQNSSYLQAHKKAGKTPDEKTNQNLSDDSQNRVKMEHEQARNQNLDLQQIFNERRQQHETVKLPTEKGFKLPLYLSDEDNS